jgi:hypothetical protein
MGGHWEVGRGAAHIMFKNHTVTRRIVAEHRNGISVAELELMHEAMSLMWRKARKAGLQVLLISIGDALFDLDYATRLDVTREAKKRITTEQRRAGIPKYLLEVIELLGSAGFHSHIVCVGNEKVIATLKRSEWLAPYTVGPDAIQDITERKGGWIGVFRYLSEERTNPANRSRFRPVGLPPRKPATKLLGAGDRVRVSSELKSDLIKGNNVRPFTATHWQHQPLVGITSTPFSPHVQRRLKKEAAQVELEQSPAIQVTKMTISGQISMFPELEQPIVRLVDFTAGILSPSASLELEHRRKRLGLSQSQLGMIAGLSQPQIANAVHGRFGLSRHSANRIKAALFPSQQRQAA